MIHRKCASTVAKTKPCHSGAGRTIARKGKGPHDQNGLLHVEFTKLDCSLPGSHLRSVRSDNRMAGGPGFHCHKSAAYLSAGASLIWGCPTLLARFWREGGHALPNLYSQRHSHPLSPPPRPFRFDLDRSFNSRRIMAEAAPGPVFRFLNQSPLDRLSPQREQQRLSLGTPKIAMHVP